jgi:glycosyltransferase involved in cell wall biosynthesis
VLSVPGTLKSLDGLLYATSLLRFLSRLRRRFQFDLIDAHFAYPDGLAAVLLGRVFRCPVVITLRGSIVRLSTYSLHRPQLRFALRKAARVIAVSQSLKEAAIRLGIDPEKIRVIPNGVDTTRFYPRNREAARRQLRLPADRTILLSIGGLNEGKGHHRVVGLLPRLISAYPDLLFVIVGGERPSDTVRPLINRLIERRGLADHVHLVGERPHEEIPIWLASADLLCLATRSEGWANVLLEATACARPVVTTHVGGNPEVLPDESLGILVPPDDDHALEEAIRRALRSEWDTKAMVAHAAAYSWDRAAAAVLDEFCHLVDEPTAGPSVKAGSGVVKKTG